ncbi:MAG: hypothetical protein QG670_2175, partial [Thermoproteota archaeon]|nr:hypothetical protein [Thermoproteota archaeon]
MSLLQSLNINLDKGIWRPSSIDLITLKIISTSNNASENVFIGIANEVDAQVYLNNVRYDEITRFNFNLDGSPNIQYSLHQGSALSDPLSQTFWVSSVHGIGMQTLQWSPQTGKYWIILMNEDASVGIDYTVSI